MDKAILQVIHTETKPPHLIMALPRKDQDKDKPFFTILWQNHAIGRKYVPDTVEYLLAKPEQEIIRLNVPFSPQIEKVLIQHLPQPNTRCIQVGQGKFSFVELIQRRHHELFSKVHPVPMEFD